MKRILILLIFAVAVLLLFTSCQATPDEPVVIQKDMEQMIEKAQTIQTASENPGNALAQRLGVPERFIASENYSDGKLTLTADAEIILPDASALPTLRVEPTDFSQEAVNRFYDVLIDDTPMYQQKQKPTKSQIQDSIVEWQRILNDPNRAEESKRQAEQEIAELNEAYGNAADDVELVPDDAAIEMQIEYHPATGEKMMEYIGVNLAEKPGLLKGKTFSVRNNNKNGEIIVEEDEFGATVTDTASQGARFNYYNYDIASNIAGVTLPVETVTPDGLTDRPERVSGFSYQKAIDMAQDFLNKTGTADMQVDSLTLKYVLPDKYMSNLSSGKPTEHMAFLSDVTAGKYDGDVMDALIDISLVRVVNGIKVTSGEFSSYIGDAMYGAQWYYEKFTIGVCSKGIYSVSWESPHNITDTVTEDTNLKPFDEISEVFDKMYRVTYEAQTGGIIINGTITSVTLTLRRIMDQNNLGYGLFVPVWDFYGTMTVDYPEEPPQDWLSNKPLLTINAIDGTVIDLEKGY